VRKRNGLHWARAQNREVIEGGGFSSGIVVPLPERYESLGLAQKSRADVYSPYSKRAIKVGVLRTPWRGRAGGGVKPKLFPKRKLIP